MNTNPIRTIIISQDPYSSAIIHLLFGERLANTGYSIGKFIHRSIQK